jgi:cystathionine beta-lyase/cystathionine gamma-synthase
VEGTNQTLRQGAPVGGEFAITGTLPTLDDLIAFKEHTAEFNHGYFRFISHPHLRRLEEALKSRFACRHCRLTESLQSALLELFLCLHSPGTACRILMLATEESEAPFISTRFLPACERQDFTLLAGEGGCLPSDLGRDDVVLVVPGSNRPVPSAILEAAQSAQAAGAAVVVVLTSTGSELPAPLEVPAAKFHALGLFGPGGLTAGAVLSSADRVMDRLADQVKRRGAVLSARAADCLMGGTPSTSADVSSLVAGDLCRLEEGKRAFLYSSGMAALTRVLDLLRKPGKSQVIAVGHLYNDTYQTLRLGPNIFVGVDELDSLDGLITDQTAAILTETITNPLSDVPDLDQLFRAARARGVPLVVDNTIATPANCRPFDHGADYVIHSTTKFLNGQNDHGGGVVIVRDLYLAQALDDGQARLHDRMSPLEAATLLRNLRTFPQRMARFNENARRVAAFLESHRGVSRVFFNDLASHRSHATAKKMLRGPGSVIGFTLRQDTWEGLRAFYDSRLDGIVKAPSLGSDLTLLCPYTLLTHYDDTDEQLAEIGLPRFLVRVSVGCEKEVSAVIESLDQALRKSLEE